MIGEGFLSICNRLKAIKARLKVLHLKEFCGVHKNIQMRQGKLGQAQKQFAGDPYCSEA